VKAKYDMLPLQLLRTRITDKGTNIVPRFCTADDSVLQLAAKIIKEFEESWKNKEKKLFLTERIALLESEYNDYKLARGFYTLLERRCIFTKINEIKTESKAIASNIDVNNNNLHDPVNIRKELFEESSKRGFALTEFGRREIIDTVASRINVHSNDLIDVMWSDLEENLVLEWFDAISPEQLLAWYNLSLMQTLLFNCTKLEFSVSGGSNWKRILRDIKRLGLMYNLQYIALEEEKRSIHVDEIDYDNRDIKFINASNTYTKNNPIIICSLDGPLSIFKLTDRYGTSIAKILPSIISSDTWSLKAWIVRKTMSLGKKIYEFKISNKDTPPLSREPYYNKEKDKERKRILYTAKESSQLIYFDSGVEEKFSTRFEQSATGWKLIREPDPLILSNGKALIPDFAFEKYGTRIYLEIVGFWTKEYLEKKIQKIADLTKTIPAGNNAVDFFIAINDAGYASSNSNIKEKLAWEKITSSISKERLIFYKNDKVPIKPFLEYLKSIDAKMIERLANNNSVKLLNEIEDRAFTNAAIISIDEIADKCNLPIESALRIITTSHKDDDNSSISNPNNKYVVAGTYLISKSKLSEFESLFDGITKFTDACSILDQNNIPESCHMDLISKIGYDVLWQSMDSSTAIIKRRI
jgi:predicted nuclease of restriction endonuclease-like RecB superfamily